MPRPAHNLRAAFTIVEMLVVVAIIVVLMSILLVAVAQARGAAQRASTTFTMNAISKALVQFQGDVGYLPPVLGARTAAPASLMIVGQERDAVRPPEPGAGGLGSPTYAQNIQGWFSDTSLAEYLLGYGDRTEDGYGAVGDYQQALSQFANSPGVKETPSLGIRNPGPDGVWGAWTNPRDGFPAGGQLVSRRLTRFPSSDPPTLAANEDVLSGKVYGPYLDLKEGRVLGRLVDNNSGDVAFPGDSNYDETRPMVITDYWGKPIRYYRRAHAHGDPKATNLPRQSDGSGTLADVFVLRPWTLRPGTEADGIPDNRGDTTTSKVLLSAPFALFSPGPDRSFEWRMRADVETTLNKDNIVEVGQ